MTLAQPTAAVPAEETALHTRLLKAALELEHARAYWTFVGQHGRSPSATEVFENFVFGPRSLPRVEILLQNLRARFDAFPAALAVLARWPAHLMQPATRRLICHWHLQLSDPLYRAFTGDYLPSRLTEGRPITRDIAAAWVREQGAARWTAATRNQFASKLLSAAYATGLVATTRDPRPLTRPRVPDEALLYVLYLLHQTRIAGTLVDNPYLASVGLAGPDLEAALRVQAQQGALTFRRQGELVELNLRHPDLSSWATETLSRSEQGAHP